jgi:hypothetical protein
MDSREADDRTASERLPRGIDAADRLVASAAAAVSSFYPAGAKKRFLRDTLDKASTPFTTGGAAVAAELWDLSEHLEYVKVAVGEGKFPSLVAQRDAASAWLANGSNTLRFTNTFGTLNAYTTSVAAYQIVRAKPRSDRATVFGAHVLNLYGSDWPVLRGVEAPHPYVAYRVFRAAEAAIDAGVTDRVAAATPKNLVKRARVRKVEDFEGALRAQQDDPLDVAGARQRFMETAKRYLWQQHGFAVPGSSSAPNSLSYDPVGTCFALDMLVRGSARLDSANKPSLPTEAPRQLGEYEDLIQLSVRHVLARMTPTGSLAYGLPFSYIEKGMGAFATSISGLAALTRVLNWLFERSRRSSYENARFLEELLGANADLFDRLFALPTAIEGSKRQVSIKDREFSGWSTDRAPSFERIESWVSMDVLLFAVHLRLLAQEVAQFRVVEKYGGMHVTDAPLWPYPPGKAPREPVADDVLEDPDQLAPGANKPAKWERLSPAAALHSEYRDLMVPGSNTWKTDKSAFLLFGPPGTGKSLLARSLAQALSWHYFELTPSNFVDRGLEMIEGRSREIFEELGVLRESVVLFDELDSLLMDREQLDRSTILNFTVPAMLPKLQNLTRVAKKQRLLLIFATNYYDRLDAAMARRGRIDERLVVLPHNATARRRILTGACTGKELVKAVDDTALAVFEDMQRYRADILRRRRPAKPIAGVNAALYFSRIPPAGQADIRSAQRLAIEVAEVVGRLLGEQRTLNADAGPDTIMRRLTRLERKLPAAPNEWRTLCENVRASLLPKTA